MAKRQGTDHTYADYLTWGEDERWELIDGQAHDMTPAPAPRHQLLLGELFLQVRSAIGRGPCQVFLAPFDVRLPDGEDHSDLAIRSVVQPDLSIIRDAAKIDRAGCVGAPDLVAEILSPSTAYKDQTAKLSLYERHGVRECWLLNPERNTVLVYLLEAGGGFGKPSEYRSGERLPATAVPGLEVDLSVVFAP